LILILKPLAAEGFSAFSLVWFIAMAKAFSGSTFLVLLRMGNCLSLGKSWYFRWFSGGCCCILQVKAFSMTAAGEVFCREERCERQVAGRAERRALVLTKGLHDPEEAVRVFVIVAVGSVSAAMRFAM
jgi:hypothetical protein